MSDMDTVRPTGDGPSNPPQENAAMNKLAEACAAGVSLIALAGCGQPSALDANPAEAELVDFNGYHGVWLKSESAEAFVAVKPFPRLLVFRQPGRPNVLASHRRTLEGVRTWFMEPTQCKLSSRPGRQPARVITRSPLHVEIQADPAAGAQLRTGMQVTLDEGRPALTIRHFMENLADTPRDIAVWSIVALPQAGHAVIPFYTDGPQSEAPKAYRTVVLFEETRLDDPAFALDDRALTIDFARPREAAAKIGVRTNATAATWTDGTTTLHMALEYDPRARYPEGGANVTAFLSGGPAEKAWCELEHVGPLQVVAPGKRAWLKDRLRLSTSPPDDAAR
jgi:hypothetical protein